MKYHGRALGMALIAEGVVPPTARYVELHIPADGAVVLRYEVMVDETDIPKLQRALGTLLRGETTSDTGNSQT